MYNCCKLDSYACVCVCVFQHMLVVCVRHTAAIMRHLNPSFTCVCECVCVCVCVSQHMLVVCVRHTAAIMRHLNPSFTCVCVCVCVCPSTWWWCVYATLLLL